MNTSLNLQIAEKQAELNSLREELVLIKSSINEYDSDIKLLKEINPKLKAGTVNGTTHVILTDFLTNLQNR